MGVAAASLSWPSLPLSAAKSFLIMKNVRNICSKWLQSVQRRARSRRCCLHLSLALHCTVKVCVWVAVLSTRYMCMLYTFLNIAVSEHFLFPRCISLRFSLVFPLAVVVVAALLVYCGSSGNCVQVFVLVLLLVAVAASRSCFLLHC